ncbi:glycosyltransferase family 2 protein [Prevotella sp. kh1p2]|uniref:glycosyltransferase family 2 protein n=1 Tax=Prevotella sp. kh1p2 TaxID=1761883 RepID=UPI0008C68F2E|nr:glycosyltransferase family 2 protein [Prevotella sp. kh1p2]SES98857.1 Glycosyltransferase, GT2 family [Prevotella sp. kh1p2]SNU11497.1 Glycosyltransferase, GT2 family [Prevotellaceae bacterium KH2P17]
MKLSVVIVSYNVKDYLEQCLQALCRALQGIDAEVFVVDNHSKDGSAAYIQERFRQVKVISCNHNLGFARANNIAIRQCAGEYVLLLNPDTVVGEHTLRDVISVMDGRQQIGAAGVCMLHADGSKAMESRRGIPSPMTAFYKMCGLCARYPRHRRFARYYMSYLPWDKAARIEVVSGAFCLFRHQVIAQIGNLDEDFFMYGEDIDFSYRLLKAGWENWYVPSHILHYKGESTQKSSFRYVHVFYEAMFIFFRKHYGGMSVLLSLPIKTAIFVKASSAFIGMGLYRMRRMLGFSGKRREPEPQYVFMGSKESLEQCRQIAVRRGLNAVYMEGSKAALPAGHLGRISPDKARTTTYVVYDVASYAYEDIFAIFSQQPDKNVRMGFFDNQTNKIITGEEVWT